MDLAAFMCATQEAT